MPNLQLLLSVCQCYIFVLLSSSDSGGTNLHSSTSMRAHILLYLIIVTKSLKQCFYVVSENRSSSHIHIYIYTTGHLCTLCMHTPTLRTGNSMSHFKQPSINNWCLYKFFFKLCLLTWWGKFKNSPSLLQHVLL